jgi:hypothetical protein
MASPAVAGAVAVLLGEAGKRNVRLTVDEIRKIVMDSARVNPPASTADNRYGTGRISVRGMISQLPSTVAGSVNHVRQAGSLVKKQPVKATRKKIKQA